MPTSYRDRPLPSEYAPYYGRYVDLVPPADIVALLATQIDDTLRLLDPLTEDDAGRAYAPGKWTVKEVVGHLIDTERIFAHRALRFSRSDAAPLPGFEQDDYVRGADFSHRTLHHLADEFQAVRSANVLFFQGLSAPAMQRQGVASGVTFSVRALAYLIAGHERHHRKILRERYL